MEEFIKLTEGIDCPVWRSFLQSEFKKSYFVQLQARLKREYQNFRVYPSFCDVLNAFRYTPFGDCKVVILGQDPYHAKGQATGLAFSVDLNCKIPPSLANIFDEVSRDVSNLCAERNLIAWAKQGVLLLNSTLTVREGLANSHKDFGWQILIDNALQKIAQKTNLVAMLWGNFAISKQTHFDKSKHLILSAPHPSPLSAHRGFKGCGHFSKCNKYLFEHCLKPINW